jgi:large subunit ribosomal protein L25
MKSLAITGTRRAAQTKQETRQLRAEGKIPCVLYGGAEQIHFSTPVLSLRSLVYSPDVYIVDLDVDGSHHKAVMREIQFHPINDKLLHIDFLEVRDDKKVTVDIPVRLKGSAVGVRAGGQQLHKLRMLKISALPANLPDVFEIKVDDMEIGDAVRVRDMKLEGVEFLDIPSNTIVAVKTARAVVEETPVVAATTAIAEGAAAPGAAPGAPGATPAAGAAPAAGAPAAGAAPAKEEKKDKKDKKEKKK